jgi:hypothetical protein
VSRAELDDAVHAGAAPLLAYGSNASPAVLAAKLGGAAAAAVVAARVTLPDTDVVYSAHVSYHGAVPATLVASPGVEVDAHLLAIPADALPALDATEPNYVRRNVGDAQAYVSRHGALRVDGAPVALAAVPARRRTLRALTEPELLELLRRRLAPEQDPDRFVLAHLCDDAVRAARTEALHAGI